MPPEKNGNPYRLLYTGTHRLISGVDRMLQTEVVVVVEALAVAAAFGAVEGLVVAADLEMAALDLAHLDSGD